VALGFVSAHLLRSDLPVGGPPFYHQLVEPMLQSVRRRELRAQSGGADGPKIRPGTLRSTTIGRAKLNRFGQRFTKL
jgi:hypothetical protein